MWRNRTGPPCSVGHPTAHAPGRRPTSHAPGGQPTRSPTALQTTTTDDRRQPATQSWPIRWASNNCSTFYSPMPFLSVTPTLSTNWKEKKQKVKKELKGHIVREKDGRWREIVHRTWRVTWRSLTFPWLATSARHSYVPLSHTASLCTRRPRATSSYLSPTSAPVDNCTYTRQRL